MLEAAAADAESLARVKDVMQRHLEKFGARRELLVSWGPEGDGATRADESAADDTLAEVEDVADALGGRHVSAGEFRGGAEWSLDPDAAASRLRAFAGRLAGRELLVAVEAFPWSAIPDVDCVVDLLRRAAARPTPA